MPAVPSLLLCCYVSFLAMSEIVASTYFVYPQRDGQAELAWIPWLNTRTNVRHLSTNPTRCMIALFKFVDATENVVVDLR